MNKNLEVEKNTELNNVQNVCRLCSATVQLVSVFSKLDAPKPLVEIVTALTTIKITAQDTVSQKMCNQCVNIIIKTYQFREKAIRNDEMLKVKYSEIVKSRQAYAAQLDVASKSQHSSTCESELRTENIHLKSNRTKGDKTLLMVHPSVTKIFQKFPKIRIPSTCLHSNINPIVSMELDEVEMYFKRRKLNEKEVEQNHVAKSPFTFDLTSKIEETNRVGLNLTFNTANQAKDSKKVNVGTSSVKNCNEVIDVDLLQPISRKRKMSDSDSSSNHSVKRPLLIETTKTLTVSSSSPDLSPRSDDISNLSFTKSKQIHVCDVCNSIFSGISSYRKHQFKHLVCQFCKKKFKTLELKNEHVQEDCEVRKILKSMVNLPSIQLQKIELNVKIRQKFRKAFAAFNLMPKDNDVIQKPKAHSSEQTEISSGIIELLSDEDEKICKSDILDEDKIFPGIKITDNKLNIDHLTHIDSDIQLINSLLSQYKKLNRKVSTQTIIPTNSSIIFHRAHNTTQLKSLKQFLYFHQVPIDINYGSSFSISFKREFESIGKKKLQTWDDLICCDISFTSSTDEVHFEIDAFIQNITPYDDSIASTQDSVLAEDIYDQSLPSFLKIPVKSKDNRCDVSATKEIADPGLEQNKANLSVNPSNYVDSDKNCENRECNAKKYDLCKEVVVIEDDADSMQDVLHRTEDQENKCNNNAYLDATTRELKQDRLDCYNKVIEDMSNKTNENKAIEYDPNYLKEVENKEVSKKLSEEDNIMIIDESSQDQKVENNTEFKKYEHKDPSKSCLKSGATKIDEKSKLFRNENNFTENKNSNSISDQTPKLVSKEKKQDCEEKLTTNKKITHLKNTNICKDSLAPNTYQDRVECVENVVSQTKVIKECRNNENIIKTVLKDTKQVFNLKINLNYSKEADKVRSVDRSKENDLRGSSKEMPKIQKDPDNKIIENKVNNIVETPKRNNIFVNKTVIDSQESSKSNTHTVETNVREVTESSSAKNQNDVDNIPTDPIHLDKTSYAVILQTLNDSINNDTYNEQTKNINKHQKCLEEKTKSDIIVIDDDESLLESLNDQMCEQTSKEKYDDCFEISDEELEKHTVKENGNKHMEQSDETKSYQTEMDENSFETTNRVNNKVERKKMDKQVSNINDNQQNNGSVIIDKDSCKRPQETSNRSFTATEIELKDIKKCSQQNDASRSSLCTIEIDLGSESEEETV